MNIKKFIIMSLVGLSVFVGCNSAKETTSSTVETATAESTQTPEVIAETAEPTQTPETEVTPSPSPEVDPMADNTKTAETQIQTLAGLMGKTAKEVDAALGEPANVQNLEDTDILLVRYYKIDYLNEIVKVEVVFNDSEQVVNYISFVLLKADDVNTSKEILANALTNLYGESSIERFVDVQGRQNRNWADDTLTYDLRYFENNISLDIYPTEK